MRRMDDEIQMLLKEYGGDIDQALAQNSRLDYLYALSEQRELLLEWYDFDQSEELLQVGADYGAMTGLYRSVVRNVTVLDTEKKALETVQLRYPAAKNITCEQGTLSQYRDRMAGTGKKYQYIVMTGTPEETWDSQICAAKAHCGGCQCFGNEILGRLGARGRGTGKGAAGPAFVRRFQRTGAYVLLLSHARLPCSGIYLFR